MESSERRSDDRLRIPLEVTVAGRCGTLVDVSAGGLSVAATGLGAVGQELPLELPLPDRAPPLCARGEIVRADDARTALRFVALTPDERERVDRFVFANARVLVAG